MKIGGSINKILGAIVVLFLFTQGALAQSFDINQKPDPAPASIIKYLGEYSLDDKKIIVREAGGRLHIIFNPIVFDPEVDGENAAAPIDWPLSRIDTHKYTYSFSGTHATIQFQLDDNGQGARVLINGDKYERNYIEPRDGNTFKVSLDKPIEEYIADALAATPPVQNGDFLEPDLVDITSVIENVKLDVRYATDNNFLGAPTYSLAKSFTHRPAAMALKEANKMLNKMGYGLLIHDAYRPWYVSKIFWDATEGPERDFVANPDNGSIHNRGSAIDLTLYNLETGDPIKMVATYDEMSDRSYPGYMGGTALERWHRGLLRHAMEEVGFTVLVNEWWHFDYKDWDKYPILNQTFEELLE